MLARVDGRLKVPRVEVGRAGDNHHVDAAGDHLLVGVEAEEAMVVVDGDLVGLDLLERSRAA